MSKANVIQFPSQSGPVPSAAAARAAVEAALADVNPFGWLDVNDLLCTPLGAPRWLVKELELGPGRPCGLWGYGGTGKSWIAIALGLCVASGAKLFDRYEVRRGNVAHLSHELGSRVLKERYRRLANGMGLEPSDVGGRLVVAPYPSIHLNDDHAEEDYAETFHDTDLVILDSIRRALPGEDENDSAISNYLDILARVSDRTGTTFLTLHHTNKDALDSDADPRTAGRGSSALYDASGCLWLVQGSGKGPRTLTQIRAHDDGEGGILGFSVDLVPVSVPEKRFDTHDKPPMDLRLVDAQELERRHRGAIRKAHDGEVTKMLELIREQPGISKRRIRLTSGMGHQRCDALLAELIEEGRIEVKPGERGATLYSPAPGPGGPPV